jgi:CheY-like chemotaxis protein
MIQVLEQNRSANRRQLRIAIADDEPDMRNYLQKILPRLGHEVVAVAADGRELVELCRAHRPDLVITDERMPELNGSDAVRLIMEFYPVPFIIISAFARPQSQDTVCGAPVVNLVKPVRLPDILRALTDMQAWFEKKSGTESVV